VLEIPPPLPRGRHGLRRDEVEQAQRLRIAVAMAAAIHAKGYVGTSVADVLAVAGVSRETFYQLFSSKLECFLDACDLVADDLLDQVTAAIDGGAGPLDRLERGFAAYFDAIAADLATARLLLVEVHAAGPEAMQRRSTLEQRLVEAFATVLDARTDSERFACQVVVTAMSAMVSAPLVAGDIEALRRLERPVQDHVLRLTECGSIFPR
jgi:AcrR family transcriptional regulator